MHLVHIWCTNQSPCQMKAHCLTRYFCLLTPLAPALGAHLLPGLSLVRAGVPSTEPEPGTEQGLEKRLSSGWPTPGDRAGTWAGCK